MRTRTLIALMGVLSLAACEGTPGKDGAAGADGADGAAGEPGADGADGEDGAPGADGADGADGEDGEDGADASAIDADGDGVNAIEDCDDADDSVGAPTMHYIDYDGDGYGYEGVVSMLCEPMTGWVANMDDCDDLDDTLSPDATEVCDGIDNNCDGTIDDDDPALDASQDGIEIYVDADGDGYGDDAASATWACSVLSGYVAWQGDCDDADSAISPDAEEICDDGIDQNCDGGAPECFFDTTEFTADSDADFELQPGEGSLDYFGRSMVVGDFNSDGYDDLVVGADGNDDEGTSSGKMYLYYGGSSLGSALSTPSATFTGSTSYSYLGQSAQNAGDVNGDGIDDVIVGEYGNDSAYIMYGSTSTITGDYDVSTAVAGAGGAIITHSSPSNFARDVQPAGDVNGDGYDDVLISNYVGYSSSTATVYLLHGSMSGLTGAVTADTAAAASFTQGDTYGYFGREESVSGGDFNGDGFADVVAGEYQNGDDGTYSGRAFLWAGPTSGAMAASGASVTFTATGTSGDTALGYQTESLGDFNGDGIDDLAIGGYYYDGGASDGGGVFVYFGATTWASTVNVDEADITIHGSVDYEYFSWAHKLNDIDGDGVNELMAAAPNYEAASASTYGVGIASVFMGGTAPGVYDAYGDYDANFVTDTTESYTYLGWAGASADMDGDGESEVLTSGYGIDDYGSVFGFELAGGSY